MISHKVLVPYSIALGFVVLIGITTTDYWSDMVKLRIAEANNTSEDKKEEQSERPEKQAIVNRIMNTTPTMMQTPTPTKVQEVAGFVATQAVHVTPTPTPLFHNGVNIQIPTPTGAQSGQGVPLIDTSIETNENSLLPHMQLNVNPNSLLDL